MTNKNDSKPSLEHITAIIVIKTPDLRAIIRQELNEVGVEDIHACEEIDIIKELLFDNPKALLVIDWKMGERFVVSALIAAQGNCNIDTRPIYFMAQSTDTKMVAMALEYNVVRILTGEITRDSLKKHLKYILDFGSAANPIKTELQEVLSLRSAGDWDGANIALKKLLVGHPGNELIALELVNNLMETDQWDSALKILEKYGSKNKLNLRAHHLQARCLMKKGDFAKASEILQEAKLINPLHVERLVDLGNCLINTNRIKEARKNFELALDLDVSSRTATMGEGQCRLLEGDINDALTLFKQITAPAELASIFNNSAILSIRQKKFDHGMDLYNTAIKSVGNRKRLLARLLYNMGIAYIKQTKNDEALECFEQAYQLDAGFTKASHNIKVLSKVLDRSVNLTSLIRSRGDQAQSKELYGEFTIDLDDEALSA